MATLILLGFSIGLDNLIVGLGIGTAGLDARRRWQLAIGFGFFEGLMPLAGFMIGKEITARLAVPWLGPLLLILTAGLIFLGAYLGQSAIQRLRHSAWLLMLPFLLSFDNLLAGSALGVLDLSAFWIIGGLSAVLAGLGLFLGDWVGRWIPKKAPLLGAVGLLIAALLSFE